jgi:hypothetical protein
MGFERCWLARLRIEIQDQTNTRTLHDTKNENIEEATCHTVVYNAIAKRQSTYVY